MKLILTSCGLNTSWGKELIHKELKKDGNLQGKRIFVFHEPYYFLEPIILQSCIDLGFKKENVIFSSKNWERDIVGSIEYIYVTEGEIFKIMKILRERELDKKILQMVLLGTTYIGASAGAMIAGESIREAIDFEKNNIGITNFDGLGIFPGLIIPHYTPGQLKRYIDNSPGIEEKYNEICAVPDKRVLVIESE